MGNEEEWAIHTRARNLINFSLYRDRLRTSINVLGDAIGAGIVQKLSEKELQDLSAKEKYDSEGEGGTDNPAMDPEVVQSSF